MSGMLGGEYRDETRIVHMLQALERIEQETGETSRDKLFFDDRLAVFQIIGAVALLLSLQWLLVSHPFLEGPLLSSPLDLFFVSGSVDALLLQYLLTFTQIACVIGLIPRLPHLHTL